MKKPLLLLAVCFVLLPFIGGGNCNTVSAAYNHSSILGGDCNVICSNCAVILGGCNNSIPAGMDWAGVFGCNIIAQAGNTFHVSCLNACNTPEPGGSYPAGTIYWDDIVNITPGLGCKVLLIA